MEYVMLLRTGTEMGGGMPKIVKALLVPKGHRDLKVHKARQGLRGPRGRKVIVGHKESGAHRALQDLKALQGR
ncbi:MAG: hypothetical protein QXS96_08520 [Candidatus Caldarchaeum sp.]